MQMASENQGESPPAGGAFQDTVRVAARAGVLKRTAVSRARPYVLAVVAAGCIVLVHSIVRLRGSQLPLEWWTLVALTIVSGSAVLKLPAIPSHFSISDVFTLTAAVVAGPAGGTVLVAIDSLAISRRLARTGLPLERIVFNAAAPPLAMWLSAQAFFAASGIAGVRVDIRGSGESDGVIDGEYTPLELANACELVAWIAAQPWSNGAVGMMGISWGGFNCLQVAALKPPALKAVIDEERALFGRAA